MSCSEFCILFMEKSVIILPVYNFALNSSARKSNTSLPTLVLDLPIFETI